MGLLVGVVVWTADLSDAHGGSILLGKLHGRFPRLKKIWAETVYGGFFAQAAWWLFGWVVEVVKPLGSALGDELLHDFPHTL